MRCLARVALRIMCDLESMYSLCHVCARLVCVCLANYTIIIIIRFGFAQEERIRVATARNGQNIAPRAAYISNMRNRSLIARIYFFIYVVASRLWCRTVVCRNVPWEYIRVQCKSNVLNNGVVLHKVHIVYANFDWLEFATSELIFTGVQRRI